MGRYAEIGLILLMYILYKSVYIEQYYMYRLIVIYLHI